MPEAMSGNARYAEWIAVDWGTSNMRAWAMDGARPKAEARSEKGMGALRPDEFEGALKDVWLYLPGSFGWGQARDECLDGCQLECW